MRLVEKFRSEQASILQEIEVAREFGVITEQGSRHLIGLRERLLDHLGEVDRRMYAALRAHARKDDSLRSLLDRFGPAVQAVSVLASDFFHKHLVPGHDDFFGDWGELYVRLRQRFRHEETMFFKRFERIELVSMGLTATGRHSMRPSFAPSGRPPSSSLFPRVGSPPPGDEPSDRPNSDD